MVQGQSAFTPQQEAELKTLLGLYHSEEPLRKRYGRSNAPHYTDSRSGTLDSTHLEGIPVTIPREGRSVDTLVVSSSQADTSAKRRDLKSLRRELAAELSGRLLCLNAYTKAAEHAASEDQEAAYFMAHTYASDFRQKMIGMIKKYTAKVLPDIHEMEKARLLINSTLTKYAPKTEPLPQAA